MAETTKGSVMARTRSDASLAGVADTLHAQQKLLQKLYADLDEERESSATAASEAMGMILRLQREKAVVEMEASHYKRLAEEKICHVEATLEAFEELVSHREMEITSLEFQVQAYKQKLMSLGCDFNASEFDQKNGENVQRDSNVRRLHSMPHILLKKKPEIARNRERERRQRSASPVPKVVLENIDHEVALPSLDLTKKSVEFLSGSGTLDSYWNKIRLLDEKVKMISQASRIVQQNPKTELNCITGPRLRLDSTNSDESTQDRKEVNVHDVYQVPQARGKHEVNDNGRKRPSLKDIVTILGKKKEKMNVDFNSKAELQKLNQRIARLEKERRISTREEITCEGGGEEQLKLLKDIQNQLKLIQLDTRSCKTVKATHVDDVSLGPLQEAMLYFWL